MGRTWKDSKSANTRKPSKKERRQLDKLKGNERLGAYHLSKANKEDFKSEYRKLKIED